MKNYIVIKRLFDIVLSTIGMLMLIPLIIIIKIITILTGDFNTIFYTQKRVGKDGKLFKLYKFRSMMPNAENVLDVLLKNDKKLRDEYKNNKKLSKDPRITKIGRFLRKSNIDEFPQMINVFIGNMSIVGSRPYLENEINDIGKYYDKIIMLKPGITGIWQTSGRHNKTFKYRCKLESKYYKKICFSLDLKIVLKTFLVVFKGL